MAGVVDVVRVDGCGVPAGEVAQARVGEGGAQPACRHHTEDVVDVHAPRRSVADDDAVPLGRRKESSGIGDGG